MVSVEFLGLYRPWLLQLGLECLGIANANYTDGRDETTLKLLLDRPALIIHFGDAPTTNTACLHADEQWWHALFQNEAGDVPPPSDTDTPARIVCSSGTTGEVKIIPQTLAQLDFRGRSYGDLLEFDGDTRFMVGMGFAVQLDQLLATTCLRRGGSCHYAGTISAPEAIAACDPTHALLLPMHLAGLTGEANPAKPEGFLTIAVTGGHVPEAVRSRLLPKFPHRLIEAYATNETSAIATMAADGTGAIMPGVTVEIVDAEDKPQPEGTAGQVRVKSPGTTDGYLFEPDAVQSTFRDGWFYPGDIGRMEASGRLRLLGRDDDLLNLHGLKINAPEYERGFAQIPGIVDAGLLTGRDENGYDVLVVALVLEPDQTLDALAANLAQILPTDVVGIRLAQVTNIPRTATGKLQRHILATNLSG